MKDEQDKKTDEQITKVFPIMCELKKRHVKGKEVIGWTICPICGGKMDYRVSGYNKHVWLKCETLDCLVVME